MLHMIVEQTKEYTMRMRYRAENHSFEETGRRSLFADRGFTKPYGWVKESGTPPKPHNDCILMSDKEYQLGDEVAIKIIGLFMRADLDHKYVAVEYERDVNDLSELPAKERDELTRLYPRVGEGEGWFGKEKALACMQTHPKAL